MTTDLREAVAYAILIGRDQDKTDEETAYRVLAVLAEHAGGDAIEAIDEALHLASADRTLDPGSLATLRRSLIILLASARAKALEEAAQKIGPDGPRPCDCERCDCMNVGDAEAVAAWDERAANAAAIRALAGSAAR